MLSGLRCMASFFYFRKTLSNIENYVPIMMLARLCGGEGHTGRGTHRGWRVAEKSWVLGAVLCSRALGWHDSGRDHSLPLCAALMRVLDVFLLPVSVLFSVRLPVLLLRVQYFTADSEWEPG
jgi:hypothetical protein